MTGRPIENSLTRFWKKVTKTNTCWNWTGAVSSRKYGTFWKDNRNKGAHIAAYEFFKGDVPRGAVVRHTCDNPKCVNPEHLILGTHQDNMNDMVLRQRSLTGSKNPNSRLTEIEIADIRNLSYKTAIAKYGIGITTFYRIKNREHWSHI